jgi:perosamine synthetase
MRRQLPVYSPLNAAAVAAAFAGADAGPEILRWLEAEYGMPRVLLTDSGTTALTLALRVAAARRPGLPCVLPGYGCYDLATAALGAGVSVRLYDLDPATLAPEPTSLARALEGGAAALVVVHLYGIPVPMGQAREAAGRAGALLIEDAAQGIGGSWRGAPLGAHGDLSVLSFGRGKGMTAGGGGALMARDPGLVSPMIESTLLAAHAGPSFAFKLLAQWLLGRPGLYAVPASIPALRLGETVYHAPGPLRRMRRAATRVLRETRRLLGREAAVRREHAARLSATAFGPQLRRIDAGAESVAGWLRFPVLLAPGHRVHRLSDARLGIFPGYPIALGALPEFSAALDTLEPLPGAQRLVRDLWTLPTHGLLDHRDIHALEHWISSDAGLAS